MLQWIIDHCRPIGVNSYEPRELPCRRREAAMTLRGQGCVGTRGPCRSSSVPGLAHQHRVIFTYIPPVHHGPHLPPHLQALWRARPSQAAAVPPLA